MELLDAGMTAQEASESTGVPRGTILRWRQRGAPLGPAVARYASGDELIDSANWSTYAYLLGLYLGDGYLARCPKNVFRLEIALDSRYPGIIGEAHRAMRRIMSKNRVAVHRRVPDNLVYVTCYSTLWPLVFPQHGPGLKHQRRITLAEWQRSITAHHAQRLLRGLIHSDGSRFVANQRSPRGRVYSYPRYAFTNRSSDILRIFCDHLDLLEIGWTLTSRFDVQIARRTDVKRLDAFIGPKR